MLWFGLSLHKLWPPHASGSLSVLLSGLSIILWEICVGHFSLIITLEVKREETVAAQCLKREKHRSQIILVAPPTSAPPTETRPITGPLLRPDAWLTAAEELVGYSQCSPNITLLDDFHGFTCSKWATQPLPSVWPHPWPRIFLVVTEGNRWGTGIPPFPRPFFNLSIPPSNNHITPYPPFYGLWPLISLFSINSAALLGFSVLEKWVCCIL